MNRMHPKITGTTQVGRCTIKAKVGFGLKITPKIRAKELSEAVAAGEGLVALAMLEPPCTRNLWMIVLLSASTPANEEYFRASLTFF
jgi:hypothetical protein